MVSPYSTALWALQCMKIKYQNILIPKVEKQIFPVKFWNWLEKKVFAILPRISMIATVGFHMFHNVSCWLDKQELWAQSKHSLGLLKL